MTSDTPHVRFGVIGIVVMSLFAALFGRLWFLQVMTAPEYQLAARNNAVRIVQTEAPRGRIFDRKGKALVDNRRSIVVTVDWQRYDRMDEPARNALLAKLAQVLSRDRQRQASGEVSVGDPGGGVPATAGVAPTPVDPASTTTTAPTTTTSRPEGTISTEPPLPEPVTVAMLRGRLADVRFSHFKPVPVATDVSEALEVELTEHSDELPAVRAERITVRNYHYGQLLAHVLGYVGAINAEELKVFQNPSKPYENDDEIGRAGIERSMERQLRGVPGEVRYEVDARNRPVRRIDVRPPVPGNDVYLTVDIDLQYQVEKSLAAQLSRPGVCTRQGCPQGKSGSAVVLDPRNGQVLSMASYPTYDPSDFVGGIGQDAYAALIAKENQVPAENKAISGQYAPGSTWKLFSADAGLANGQISPDSAVYDPGFYKIPGCKSGDCEKQNANRQAHGTVNLTSAITVSSDVYFYKLGDEMWRRRQQDGGSLPDDALARTYTKWGFGERTGVDLPGEASGRVPTPAWKKAYAADVYAEDPEKAQQFGSWFAGDNMNAAVGQGDVLVTPLQLANGYATFANGGTRYLPQFVLQVSRGKSTVALFEPKATGTVDLPPQWRDPLLAGFKGVTVSGTAAETFAGFPQDTFPVAGKTGTAQVAKKADTSLFAAFAPADAPTFTAVAVLPEAGNGGTAAAPLIRRILEPVAVGGGTLDALPDAPLGGGFDATAAIAEVKAPPSGSGD